jgi:hypothetical protein
MSRWFSALAILGSAACGPSMSAVDDSPTSSTSSTDTSSVSTTETASSSDLASSSDATSTAADSSSGAELDCGDGDPSLGCPSGCMDATAYLGTGEDIDTNSGVRGCIPAGATIDAGYRSAWWRGDGTARRFLVAGHGCGAQIHATPLDDWQECGTSPDEPSECRRLCAQDVCPGELDWIELSECDVPSPCPSTNQPYACESVNPDLQCIHGALADRTPGRYVLQFDYPNFTSFWTFVVAADASVQVMFREFNGLGCGEALTGIWRPSQTCELADAEFFTTCFEAQTWCGGEFDLCQSETLTGWFVGCEETAATCG